MIAGALLLVLLCSAGCSAGLAYLIYNELKEDEPLVSWKGTVKDSAGSPIRDAVVMVEYKLETKADTDERTYQKTTDGDGKFDVGVRWCEHARYSVLLVYGEQSYRPPDYQGLVTDHGNMNELQFVFDVVEPEADYTWLGNLTESGGGAANGALVRIDLGGLDDERTFWDVSSDGGRYSVDYTWNKLGEYSLKVFHEGRHAAINKVSDAKGTQLWPEASEEEDTPESADTSEVDESDDVDTKIDVDVTEKVADFGQLPWGSQEFNFQLDAAAHTTGEMATLAGTVQLRSGVPAREVLIILNTDPPNESAGNGTPEAPIAWGITDDQGDYLIDYHSEGVTFYSLELIYADHSFVAIEQTSEVPGLPDQIDIIIEADGTTTVAVGYTEGHPQTWTGQVVDQDSNPVVSTVIVIESRLPGEHLAVTFIGQTGEGGEFSVEFLWREGAKYTITVLHSGTPAETDVHDKGEIANAGINDELFTITIPAAPPEEQN